MRIPPEELRFDIFRNGGQTEPEHAGEFHIRVTHIPTGLSAVGHDPERPRSMLCARDAAMRDLEDQMSRNGSG